MKRKKAFYKSININGYTWRGFWNKLHHFVKRIDDYKNENYGKYIECSCNDADIENGNLNFMVVNNLTRA